MNHSDDNADAVYHANIAEQSFEIARTRGNMFLGHDWLARAAVNIDKAYEAGERHFAGSA